jgi:hypothetical protein
MSMILDDVLATAATLRKQEAAEPRSVGSVDVEPESISEQQPDRPVETVAAPTPTQSTEPAPAVPTSSRRRRPFDPDPEAEALFTWFREHRDNLPGEPFRLCPWINITNPARFYQSLEADIAAYPDGPRSHVTAGDIRRLMNRADNPCNCHS